MFKAVMVALCFVSTSVFALDHTPIDSFDVRVIPGKQGVTAISILGIKGDKAEAIGLVCTNENPKAEILYHSDSGFKKADGFAFELRKLSDLEVRNPEMAIFNPGESGISFVKFVNHISTERSAIVGTFYKLDNHNNMVVVAHTFAYNSKLLGDKIDAAFRSSGARDNCKLSTGPSSYHPNIKWAGVLK